jgi:hypothetical protein
LGAEVYITQGKLSFPKLVTPKAVKTFRKLSLSLKNKNKEKDGARVKGMPNGVHGINGINGVNGDNRSQKGRAWIGNTS